MTSLRQEVALGLKELTGCAGVLWLEHQPHKKTYDLDVGSSISDESPGHLQSLTLKDDSDFARWLRINGIPLVLADFEWMATYVSTEDADLLSTTRTRICVPLKTSAALSALLLLTHETGQWRLLSADYLALVACARQASIACELMARREAEREELLAKTRAQQLVVAGQLAASVAHEVRNPLTAIRSSVQLAKDSTGLSSEDRHLLGQIVDEVDRINKTISGIVSLSRPNTLEREDLDLEELLEHVLTFMLAYLNQRDLVVERHRASDPLVVRGDARELRQVLINVLLNAAQATPNGGTITITASRTGNKPDATNSTALVTIRDSGEGMTKDHLDRAFDPFFTTKTTGTGLGLPICLQIMAHHDGQIRLESTLGQGTTVSLTMPLQLS